MLGDDILGEKIRNIIVSGILLGAKIYFGNIDGYTPE